MHSCCIVHQMQSANSDLGSVTIIYPVHQNIRPKFLRAILHDLMHAQTLLKLMTFVTYNVCRKTTTKLECGPMPNVMAALPNIGGALCSTPQSLADAHY